MEPIDWLVDKILPVGLSILGAPSKYYKSYMALGLCVAICQGAKFLGFDCTKHDCLYFDLESTKRRPKNRLDQIVGTGTKKPDNLHIITGDQSPGRIGEGFEEQVEYQLQKYPNIKLIVIDVFQLIRQPAKRNQTGYDRDYEDFRALKQIVDKHDIGVLLIHHTRKMKDPSDVFNELSGSTGMLGAQDCAWLISKKDRSDTEEKKMITIARCLSEDYIHSSKLKNFCSSHGMTVSENKPELLRQIIEFAGEDESSEKYVETYDWLLEAIKEGSKEFCLKRVYVPEESIENLEQIISSKYDSCPRSDILSFKSKETASLVDYQIENDEQGIASKISFVFSTMVLEGDQENERGNRIIYPIYIDLYINEGFFVGRYKPKTTIYKCSENDIVYKENRFKPLDETGKLIESLGKILKTENMDINPSQKFGKMMYKLYQKYSFTPADIQSQIDSLKDIKEDFVNNIFKRLNLNILNKKKAKMDLDIFLEKFISINGDREKVFKEDREAYLIKISSDDIMQMTRIDTASTGNRPLQCSETFFDGKKSILNTKECKNLHLQRCTKGT